jgi:hypothetical protein
VRVCARIARTGLGVRCGRAAVERVSALGVRGCPLC